MRVSNPNPKIRMFIMFGLIGNRAKKVTCDNPFFWSMVNSHFELRDILIVNKMAHTRLSKKQIAHQKSGNSEESLFGESLSAALGDGDRGVHPEGRGAAVGPRHGRGRGVGRVEAG